MKIWTAFSSSGSMWLVVIPNTTRPPRLIEHGTGVIDERVEHEDVLRFLKLDIFDFVGFSSSFMVICPQWIISFNATRHTLFT